MSGAEACTDSPRAGGQGRQNLGLLIVTLVTLAAVLTGYGARVEAVRSVSHHNPTPAAVVSPQDLPRPDDQLGPDLCPGHQGEYRRCSEPLGKRAG